MPLINKRKLHHDLNIPLSSSSLSSKRKAQEAKQYQNRLSKLGYSEIAFTHTAYGRLKMDKDDANYTLPWKDLIPESSNSTVSDDNGDIPYAGEHCKKIRSIGQINKQLDIKVYRRLNIIVEEVSDVSRILLPNNDGSTNDGISELLQKYDIISLQPMNEPALQNICELMATSTSSSTPSNTSNSNNTHFIDIIVLEYATGSKGGHGLPYKLRKDYLVKALSAGITFEVCYGTAILDPKRRQGFIRTILDFQTAFNSIQKKHLLNKNKQKQGGKYKTSKFPLLLSSGSRLNYTLGTSDEGVLAFRKMEDVNCLVSTLMGGDSLFNIGVDDDDMNDGKKHKKNRMILSAADRVLTRAIDRALGVVSTSSGQGERKREQRDWDSRSHVVADTTKSGGCEDDDSGDDSFSPYSGGATSFVDWLSESLRKKKIKRDADYKEEVAKHEPIQIEGVAVPPLDKSNKDGSSESDSVDKEAAVPENQEKIDDSEEEEDKNDIEDGYIAL